LEALKQHVLYLRCSSAQFDKDFVAIFNFKNFVFFNFLPMERALHTPHPSPICWERISNVKQQTAAAEFQTLSSDSGSDQTDNHGQSSYRWRSNLICGVIL
jgi:hypothetical protein